LTQFIEADLGHHSFVFVVEEMPLNTDIPRIALDALSRIEFLRLPRQTSLVLRASFVWVA